MTHRLRSDWLQRLRAIIVATAAGFQCLFGNAEAETLPDFTRIYAVQATNGGGFIAVGQVRPSVRGSTYRAGFILLDHDGKPVGKPQVFPLPCTGCTETMLQRIIMLPDGDLVGVGWVVSTKTKSDIWLIRFSQAGEAIWNVTVPGDWEEKLYSVRRLASGRLVAVGRKQQGPEANAPARGYAVWVGEVDGKVQSIREYSPAGRAVRGAFQDVVELPDRTLTFAGWLTTDRGMDNIWLQRAGSGGEAAATVNFGLPESSVPWSIAFADPALIVAGFSSKPGSTQTQAVVAKADPGFRKAGPALRILQNRFDASQLRTVTEIPSSRNVVVAGTVATGGANRAYIAVLDHTADMEIVQETVIQDPEWSQFSGISLDRFGRVALAGTSRTAAGKADGAISILPHRSVCAHPPLGTEESSKNTIVQASGKRVMCVSSGSPVKVGIQVDQGNSRPAILVRPLIGDVDALLMQGDEVVDSSFNTFRAAKILTPRGEAGVVDLSISTTDELATFEIEVLRLDEISAEQSLYKSTEEGAVDGRHVLVALQTMGYDVGETYDRDGPPVSLASRRAVQAFQAAAGMAATGVLDARQLRTLLSMAGRRIDDRAQQMAATARRAKEQGGIKYVPRSETANVGTSETSNERSSASEPAADDAAAASDSEPSDADGDTRESDSEASDADGGTREPEKTSFSFTGRIISGELYGVGEVTYTRAGEPPSVERFEGRWSSNREIRPMAPIEGLLHFADGCTVSINLPPRSRAGLPEDVAEVIPTLLDDIADGKLGLLGVLRSEHADEQPRAGRAPAKKTMFSGYFSGKSLVGQDYGSNFSMPMCFDET